LIPIVRKKFGDKGEAMDDKQIQIYIESILNTETFFNLVFGVNITNFHYFYAQQVDFNDTAYTDVILPVNNKAGKIDGVASTYIRFVDTLTNEVEFVVVQDFDPEQFSELTKDITQKNQESLIKIMPRKSKRNLKKGLKNFNKELKETQVFFWQKLINYLDYDTGWPTEITFIKSVDTKGKEGKYTQDLEETIIKLSPKEEK
jgi:hypothetical protein